MAKTGFSDEYSRPGKVYPQNTAADGLQVLGSVQAGVYSNYSVGAPIRTLSGAMNALA